MAQALDKQQKMEQKQQEKQKRREEVQKRREARSQQMFLLRLLVSRDFKTRYKRSTLGILWSLLGPLANIAAQAVVFSFFFNRGEHYISYLVVGNIVFNLFSDITTNGMFAISANAGILSSIKVNKYLFLLSKSYSCAINFLITAAIMFGVAAVDGVAFHWNFLLLLYPAVCLFLFSIGVALVLCVLYIFFKDTQYIYGVFMTILRYFSALFYYVEAFPESVRNYFYLNPVYCYMYYFRSVILYNEIPAAWLQIWVAVLPILALAFGVLVFRANEKKFIFYY